MSVSKVRKTGIQQLMKLSPSLSSLLGKQELTRADAVKSFWDYVKTNKLQDPKDGRIIHPNGDMSKVFGSGDIHLTQVMGHLSKHLEKKNKV